LSGEDMRLSTVEGFSSSTLTTYSLSPIVSTLSTKFEFFSRACCCHESKN
jgi:hypothetical protein